MSSPRKAEIRAMVERMRLAYGVDKKQLPQLFGCKENTINNWVYYGRIPLEQLEQCRKVTGKSLDWLMYGKVPGGAIGQNTEEQVKQLVRRILCDGLEFGVLVESYEGGGTSVANKMCKEITLIFDPAAKKG